MSESAVDDNMDDLEPGHAWVPTTAPKVDQDDMDTSKQLLHELAQHEAFFTAPYGVKMLRETLTLTEKLFQRAASEDGVRVRHLATVAALIEQCDMHRPLGSNGKHGDLHTATCGCDRG